MDEKLFLVSSAFNDGDFENHESYYNHFITNNEEYANQFVLENNAIWKTILSKAIEFSKEAKNLKNNKMKEVRINYIELRRLPEIEIQEYHKKLHQQENLVVDILENFWKDSFEKLTHEEKEFLKENKLEFKKEVENWRLDFFVEKLPFMKIENKKNNPKI